MCEKLEWVLEHDQDDDPNSLYVRNCRELVDQMLEFLDGLEADPDMEPTFGIVMNGPAEMDECEEPEDIEPSLGSFDRVIDQVKAWRWIGDDCEVDPSDDEPSLGFLERHPTTWSFVGRDQSGNQDGLCDGLPGDLEDEHDGGEPECEDEGAQCEDEGGCTDKEPTLGWTVDGCISNTDAWNCDLEIGGAP